MWTLLSKSTSTASSIALGACQHPQDRQAEPGEVQTVARGVKPVPACPKLQEFFPRSRIGVQFERTPVYWYVAGQGYCEHRRTAEHPREAEEERERPAIREKGQDRYERDDSSRHENGHYLSVAPRYSLLRAHVGLLWQLVESRM